jgi:hypothetical protein
MDTPLTRKVNTHGMIISRIPKWAKEVIIAKAEAEHCGDYGACMAQMIRDANELDSLKIKFFNNDLNVQMIISEPQTVHPPKEEIPSGDEIKFANGNTLKRRKN